MRPGRAVEMTGWWKTRKTKPRFPFVCHRPWKSLRDSHIPTAPTISFLSKPKSQKGGLAAELRSPPGSFFDEKMLLAV
jgi:hypothetical protein